MKIYIKILFLILIMSFLFPIIILATSENVNISQNIKNNETELSNELENTSSVSNPTNDTIYAYVTNSQTGLSVSDIINIILIAVCIVQVLLSIAILIRLK